MPQKSLSPIESDRIKIPYTKLPLSHFKLLSHYGAVLSIASSGSHRRATSFSCCSRFPIRAEWIGRAENKRLPWSSRLSLSRYLWLKEASKKIGQQEGGNRRRGERGPERKVEASLSAGIPGRGGGSMTSRRRTFNSRDVYFRRTWPSSLARRLKNCIQPWLYLYVNLFSIRAGSPSLRLVFDRNWKSSPFFGRPSSLFLLSTRVFSALPWPPPVPTFA